jgi:hypothetical protein
MRPPYAMTHVAGPHASDANSPEELPSITEQLALVGALAQVPDDARVSRNQMNCRLHLPAVPNEIHAIRRAVVIMA